MEKITVLTVGMGSLSMARFLVFLLISVNVQQLHLRQGCVSIMSVVRVSWATLVSFYELFYFSGPLCWWYFFFFGLTKMTHPTSLGLA